MDNITFRKALPDDTPLILRFIKELAEYEKLEHEVVATVEGLNYWIFEQGKAEVIFCLYDKKEVGFAVFYYNFSTLLGRCGIHLEDLYVSRESRGKGCGKALLKKLAEIARERNCGRLDWCCLDWNTLALDFYDRIGAHRETGREYLFMSEKELCQLCHREK